MKKYEDKKEMMDTKSMSKHGPAWHGKDLMADMIGEALAQAQEMFKKMKGKGKGKGKGGTLVIEIEKED